LSHDMHTQSTTIHHHVVDGGESPIPRGNGTIHHHVADGGESPISGAMGRSITKSPTAVNRPSPEQWDDPSPRRRRR